MLFGITGYEIGAGTKCGDGACNVQIVLPFAFAKQNALFGFVRCNHIEIRLMPGQGLPPHHFPNRRATKGSWLLPLTRQSHCMQTLSNCCPTYVLSAGPNTMCRAVNSPWPFSTFMILGLTKRYQNSGLFGIGANCDFGKPANSI